VQPVRAIEREIIEQNTARFRKTLNWMKFLSSSLEENIQTANHHLGQITVAVG